MYLFCSFSPFTTNEVSLTLPMATSFTHVLDPVASCFFRNLIRKYHCLSWILPSLFFYLLIVSIYTYSNLSLLKKGKKYEQCYLWVYVRGMMLLVKDIFYPLQWSFWQCCLYLLSPPNLHPHINLMQPGFCPHCSHSQLHTNCFFQSYWGPPSC